MDALHMAGRYVLKVRRIVRPGLTQLPGETIELSHDEAVLMVAQGTAVPDERAAAPAAATSEPVSPETDPFPQPPARPQRSSRYER
jgi:hypothetical protein